MVKLLHIVECAGGVERYLEMLLPRLEQKNFHQSFICSFNYDKGKYQDIVDDVEQLDLKQTFSPIQVLKKMLSIRKIIKIYVLILCTAIVVLPEDLDVLQL